MKCVLHNEFYLKRQTAFYVFADLVSLARGFNFMNWNRVHVNEQACMCVCVCFRNNWRHTIPIA